MEQAFASHTRELVLELDEAAQSHLAWTHLVLRCAALRSEPADGVLADDAHCHCRFGRWWPHHADRFDRLDPVTSRRVEDHHQRMHEVARRLCRRILEGRAADAADLDGFERIQAAFVADLAILKTAILERGARLDALTGLPLRYGLEEEFERCRAQALRHDETMFAVMFDLDHFKRVNDLQGHAAGDLALRHVAALLRGHCRAGEPVFRFGGEEFLALLQAADRRAAETAVARILLSLREGAVRLPNGQPLNLSASAGIAEVGAEESMADAVARADRALFAAKAAGRDTSRWATEA